MNPIVCEKKIAVIGIGGVGGYVSALLCRAYPHVTLIARGNRKTALEQDGLSLHSDFKGDMVVRPEKVVTSIKDVEPQDIIFICVKNYSLESVCEEVKGQISEDTIIVPIMNGADVGERVKRYLGKGKVVDSLIYIVAFAKENYHILQQGKFANIRIGTKDEAVKDAVALVDELLTGADLDHKIARDIESDIWKKYILNCAYNVLTARYDNTIGELRSDEKKAKEYEALLNEAYAVSQAKGVQLDRKYIDGMIHSFYYELADNATSSLQRDLRDGKTLELDTFSGYIVEEAKRLAVDAPVSTEMYESLKDIIK